MLLHLRLYYIQDRLLHLGVLQALSIRGVTFQEECRFTTHVRNKLIEANKCLFILRSLIRREDYIYSGRYNQTICFKVVIPDLTYGLSVYTVLCRAQCFLYQCHKWRYAYLRRLTSMIYQSFLYQCHKWRYAYLRRLTSMIYQKNKIGKFSTRY